MNITRFYFDYDTLTIKYGEFEEYRVADSTRTALYKLISDCNNNGMIFADFELFNTVNNCYTEIINDYQTELSKINESIGTIKSNYMKFGAK